MHIKPCGGNGACPTPHDSCWDQFSSNLEHIFSLKPLNKVKWLCVIAYETKCMFLLLLRKCNSQLRESGIFNLILIAFCSTILSRLSTLLRLAIVWWNMKSRICATDCDGYLLVTYKENCMHCWFHVCIHRVSYEQKIDKKKMINGKAVNIFTVIIMF